MFQKQFFRYLLIFFLFLAFTYITVQKYRFNRLLTKDPSETSSLEHK